MGFKSLCLIALQPKLRFFFFLKKSSFKNILCIYQIPTYTYKSAFFKDDIYLGEKVRRKDFLKHFEHMFPFFITYLVPSYLSKVGIFFSP